MAVASTDSGWCVYRARYIKRRSIKLDALEFALSLDLFSLKQLPSNSNGKTPNGLHNVVGSAEKQSLFFSENLKRFLKIPKLPFYSLNVVSKCVDSKVTFPFRSPHYIYYTILPMLKNASSRKPYTGRRIRRTSLRFRYSGNLENCPKAINECIGIVDQFKIFFFLVAGAEFTLCGGFCIGFLVSLQTRLNILTTWLI